MKKQNPALAVTLLAVLLAGCSAKRPVVLPAAPGVQPPKPDVRVVGQDLELLGLAHASAVVWAPSGARAVVQADSGAYLLDAMAPSLKPLPDFAPAQPPAFWSDTEVAWLQDGRLQRRDLVSGQSRVIHDFGTSVTQFLRPGDTHYVVTRPNRSVEQGHQFGTIVAGALSGGDETTVIDTGYLAGRMSDGSLLAVEGPHPRGPLWSITPTGDKQLLSQTPVSFVQIAPGGLCALWLTGDAGKPPADQDAEYATDPPLTDLWIWDRTRPPLHIPLGRAVSVRAGFSPDGSRVALALNEEFASTEAVGRPGSLAVAEGGKVRYLATFAGRVGLGMWFGNAAFQFSDPNRTVVGGPSPTTLINVTGKEEDLSTGLWYHAMRDQLIPDTVAWSQLRVHWGGKDTTVHWADSDQTARVTFNPNDRLGQPLYVPVQAPYLPFAGPDRLWLKRLTY